ncbi:type I restriction-modification system subunit M [Mycoplasma sp. CSL 7498]|nr:type I restriction-modification system subunit M [Mycoplasma phocoeninasale]
MICYNKNNIYYKGKQYESSEHKKLLFNKIWKIANDLRNNLDPWEFKDYVLSFLFYYYLSKKIIKHFAETYPGDLPFDQWKDEEFTDDISNDIATTLGYSLKPSQLFQNVAKTNNQENLNQILRETFNQIYDSSKGKSSENDFQDLFSDIKIDNPKLGANVADRNKKLYKVIEAINGVNFGEFEDHEIDIFGDAYEYLIGMYAQNAGKSGGEYFTPQEVSELLARLTLIDFNDPNRGIKNDITTIYDPTCGSGSLLLKFIKLVDKEKANSLRLYGQEINGTTYNLSRINMFLHGMDFTNFKIAFGDTLRNDLFAGKEFDIIAANPPYSTRWEGKNDPTLLSDARFSPAGVLAPSSKADFAFIMHILYHLKASGSAAVVEFPGILYRSGAEKKIRQYLVENNFIDSIIQLPSDLFFGNTISTCVILFRKNKDNADRNIFFIDVTKEFIRVDSKNKLSKENIDYIVDTIRFKREIPHFQN